MGKREERVGWSVGGGVNAENPPTLPLLGHLPPGNLPLAELRGQLSKQRYTHLHLPTLRYAVRPVILPLSPGPHGTPRWVFTLTYARLNGVPRRNGDFPKVVHILRSRC